MSLELANNLILLFAVVGACMALLELFEPINEE